MLDFGAARGVWLKFDLIFVTISSALFSDLESILAPKPFQNEGSWGHFSTSLRICEKCDFEQPSYGFTTLFDFRRVDFRPLKVYFSDVFQRCFQDVLFFDFGSKLGPNSMPNGSANRLENGWNSILIVWWNFDGLSVAPGGREPRE